MKGRCEGVSIIHLVISVILHACDCVCIIVNVLTMYIYLELVVGIIKQGMHVYSNKGNEKMHMFMNKQLT